MTARVRLGAFELESELGRGGMGVVWRAVHVAQGLPVAIKVLTSASAREASFVRAFHNEVFAAARLDHPGVVLVLDTDVVSDEAAAASDGTLVAGSPWLAMELLDGGALEARTWGTSWDALRELLSRLLEALGHAHARGVTHRDIKPGNILFAGAESDAPGPRLADFGLATARAIDANLVDPTRTGASQPVDDVGSAHYMAPEQRTESDSDQGPWTDLYALGCVAWELVTGERAFAGEDLYAVTWAHLNGRRVPYRPRFPVPPGVEGWLRRMLARSPRDRFQSAADSALFLRGVERGVGSGLGVLASLPSDWRATERAPRSGQLLGAGLGLFGLRSPPLVDREGARDALWSELRATVAHGAPRCVVLHGGPGSGKSRLSRWLAERAEESAGARVLRVDYGNLPGRAVGIGPMLARALRCTGLSGEDLALRIEAEVRALGGADPYEWRALTALVRSTESGTAPHGLPRIGPSERAGAIRRLLARLAANRPVVLLLGDLHHSVEAVELLQQLLQAPPRSLGPVLLVCTVRDDALLQRQQVRERLAGLRARHELAEVVLEPLDTEAMQALVTSMLDLDQGLADALVARADGNPLFAVQLLGEQVQRGLLQPGPDGYRLDGGELALPEDVHSLWSLRLQSALADLPSAAERTVEIAAALGHPVVYDEWRRACRVAGFDAALLEPVLERLTSALLARPSPGGWRFSHGLLRESCARSAQEQDRWVPACAAAGTALLEGTDPDDVERAGLLLMEGESWESGIDALLEAARTRSRASEFQRVEELLEVVEAAIGRGVLEATCPRVGRALLLRAGVDQMLGNLDGCEELLHRVLGVDDPRWDLIQAEATGLLGSVARLRSRWDEARLLLDEALQGIPASEPLLRARVLHNLAMIERRTGYHAPAALYYGDASEYYLLAGDRLGAARCEQGLGFIANDRGDHVSARRIFESLLPILEELGERIALAATIDGLAAARMAAGDLVEAGAGHLRAWTMMEETGSPAAFISALNYVLVLLLQRDFREAELVLQAIEQAVRQPAFSSWRCQYLVYHLACDAARGDWDSWDRHHEEVEAGLSVRPPSPSDVARAAEVAARRAEESGDAERALQALELARSMLRLAGDEDALAALDEDLATVH